MSRYSYIALGAADVIEKAAARIERDGFHQGGYYPGWDPDRPLLMGLVGEHIRTESAPCCTVGAIHAEAQTFKAADDTSEILAERLGFRGVLELLDWNDDERDGEEVVSELRRVATEIREAATSNA